MTFEWEYTMEVKYSRMWKEVWGLGAEARTGFHLK